jgi:hypothetical protein
MKLIAALISLTVVALSVQASRAQADDTGFASMHSQIRVGNKRCFSDHSHGGSSSGQRTRQAAVQAAVNSWYVYTVNEYGTDWSNINKAHRRTLNCQPSSSGWGCELNAYPCK